MCHSLNLETSGTFAPFDGLRTMRLSGKVLDPITNHLVQQASLRVNVDVQPIEFHPDGPMARLATTTLIDLGAIGKGWALDKCAEMAFDVGVDRAFFHAGGSSMIAIGENWPVSIKGLLEDVSLSNISLSVSRRINPDAGGVHIATSAQSGDSTDIVARVIGSSCAITDALSTAAISGTMGSWKSFEGYDTRVIVIDNP
jgi:thiamine biosynthesis lipoprotein ApbE